MAGDYGGSGKFGFLGNPEKEEQKTSIDYKEVKNVEESFLSVIKELQLEQELLEQELKLEKQLRKRVVQLFKEAKRLEKGLGERLILLSKYNSFKEEMPKSALELLDQIQELDNKLYPDLTRFFDELKKHVPKTLDKIFDDVSLERKEQKKLTLLLNAIGNKLQLKASPLQGDVQNRSIDNARYQLLQAHPDLAEK